MSWVTRDYRCGTCEAVTIEMVDRAAEPGTLPCECGGVAERTISANITKASHVDGSGRFDDVRRHRKLQREGKKALRQGKRDDARRINRELDKLKAMK